MAVASNYSGPPALLGTNSVLRDEGLLVRAGVEERIPNFNEVYRDTMWGLRVSSLVGRLRRSH